MISRSPGLSPPSAERTSPRKSCCSAPVPTAGASSARSPASSSGLAEARSRRRRRHSFLATAYSQGRSRSGSRRPPSFAAAMMKVSCTASAASDGSPSIAAANACSGRA